MAREILNKPHPTPNPDGPHTGGSNRGTGGGVDRPSQFEAETDTDEPNYDSCHDDLNKILTEPLPEPDPVLRSKSSSDAIALFGARPRYGLLRFLHEPRKAAQNLAEICQGTRTSNHGAQSPRPPIQAWRRRPR